jgi:hypothetical protein
MCDREELRFIQQTYKVSSTLTLLITRVSAMLASRRGGRRVGGGRYIYSVYICMYIEGGRRYMYVCMYVCMYICMYIRMYV